MDNNKLAEAVAALLPEELQICIHIPYILKRKEFHDSWKLLAFECHKALSKKSVWFSGETKDDEILYLYHLSFGTSEAQYEGSGDTPEQAIFSAVLDWYSKRGKE